MDPKPLLVEASHPLGVTREAEAQLQAALTHDREGRHAAATEALGRAADVGHVAAMTLLGARYLTGRGADFAPTRAFPLLAQAAERGGADAGAIMATLTAMGAGVSQSWSGALDHLQRAAERGSDRARRQLQILGAGPGANVAPDGRVHDWRRLRAGVDVQAWVTPPPKRALCESPRIRVLEGFVSPAVCDWLIARAQGRTTPALVYDPATGAGRVEAARSNGALEFSIVDLDVVAVLLRARIGAATALPPAAMEPPQVLRYEVGQRFAPHFDFLDLANPGLAADLALRGQRIVTFLIYLNADYDGGETEFPLVGVSYKGWPGDALMFANVDAAGAPERNALHAGTPPTRGEKWLFSQWIRDRAAPGA